MYKNFNTNRMMHWWLLTEEYGPELVYIKGKHNVVADALSWLDVKGTKIPNSPAAMADLFAKNDRFHTKLVVSIRISWIIHF